MQLPTFDELGSIEALRENYAVEAKEAAGRSGRGAVPGSMWETYSAFANTAGGWILLGVEEVNGGLRTTGIGEPERLQKQIWDLLANPQKVSVNLLDEDDLRVVSENGFEVVVMRVPPAIRENRPVYIDGNPLTGTYIRRHEGDYRVGEDRVKRMLAEAHNPDRDAVILSGYGIDDLREESLKAFRNIFRSTAPDHPFLEEDDAELLRQVGGIKMNRETGEKGITAAGLLMFGKLYAIQEYFTDFFLDYQERGEGSSDGPRWTDRVCTDGSGPQNVYDFYRTVSRRLTADLKVPFRLDEEQRRVDETEVHEAIREALVNTLIHADYANSRSVRVLKFPSRFVFRNPGRLRLSKAQVLRGGESDCRNPHLQKMFQMIGAAEKAGSGVPKIVRAWKRQHWRQPNLVDDVEKERTELTLTTASLLPEDAVEALRRRFEDRFKQLDRKSRVILVTTFQEETTTHERLMEVLDDIHSRDLTLKLEELVNNEFLRRLGTGRGSYYKLVGEDGEAAATAPLFELRKSDIGSPDLDDNSPDLDDNSPDLSDSSPDLDDNSPDLSDSSPDLGDSSPDLMDESVEHPPPETAEMWVRLQEIAQPVAEMGRVPRKRMKRTILKLCRHGYRTPRQLAELVQRQAEYLRENYLSPMVEAGDLVPRHPERKHHPEQAYRAAERVDNGESRE